MPSGSFRPINRRDLARLIGTGGAALVAGLPAGPLYAQARRDTLVIGLDISDTVTFDPVRMAQYTPPMTLFACYDSLMTMAPDAYITPRPSLATSWARTPDGMGWRFTLREGVTFSTGNTMTAEDVAFTFNRLINMKEQTQQYIKSIDRAVVVDARTVDLVMNDPKAPVLTILCAPGFGIYDAKAVRAQGGTDAADAKEKDKATDWLNQNSAGTGPYRLVRWERNQQIQLVRNPTHWRGAPAFERVVIRHFSDSAAQLLAVRRGDIQVAFNLIPEQIATLKEERDIRVEQKTSLDFVYMAVTENPQLNATLAKRPARQAIGHAIDYDGIIGALLGGAAVRPAHFLPIGVNGSTPEIARQVGFRQDLDRARALLAEAGVPNGFSFELSYGQAAVAGVSYQLLAQKIQADLARVGIEAKLNPMDQVNLRTQYTGGRSTAVLTFWNPPAVENELWAAATVERVARRVGWTPPREYVELVQRAATEPDTAKAAELWVEYQKRMVDQAHLIMLFQPIYQVAVRNSVAAFPLTAAGWMAELGGAKPA